MKGSSTRRANAGTQDATARADLVARRALGVSRALLIYGLLLGGAVVFSLPFIWMIGTSFKVDREMFSEEITFLPMRPVPAVSSPYLDDRFFKEVDTARYERVEPMILEAVAQHGLNLPEGTRNGPSAAEILLPGVYRRLVDLLPTAAWEQGDEALAQSIRERVDAGMLDELGRRVLRHLRLGPVRVRSFDLQEQEVTANRSIADFWQIDPAAPARIVDIPDSATPQAGLHYDFTNAESGQVELVRTIDLPFAADRLFRIQISLQPDDSWHAVKFRFERNGTLYEGVRPEFMGNFQPLVVTLQEYGPDDQSDASKIKLWIACKPVDSGPQYESGENRVKVTMVMEQNTDFGAAWAKGYRNYRGALNYIPFWRYLSTSILLVVLNIIGNIFSCSIVAYSFARLQWPGRNLAFGLMMATLMIPPQVTMIPFFLIMKNIGWYNTLSPLWVMSFFGNAFNIFLLRQFMMGIPRDLEDAAKIDGCNFLQIYAYVMMPLIKPTLACIAIFTFMGVWNDFMGPLIFLADQRLYPLSLGLYALNVQAGGNFGMLMAGSLLMTLPVIMIFFFAQKYFIQGIALTGTKG